MRPAFWFVREQQSLERSALQAQDQFGLFHAVHRRSQLVGVVLVGGGEVQ